MKDKNEREALKAKMEEEEQKTERAMQKQQTKRDRKERNNKLKEEAKKKDKNAGAATDKPSKFTDPTAVLNSVFNFLQGIKMKIKRIHIRYEDDVFNSHRPFSLGFMIDGINMTNTDSHWTFLSPNGMQFSRTNNK